jgi:polyisoprenoid-binding protein YceI
MKCFFFLFAGTLCAQETVFDLDPAKTEVKFTLHDPLHTVHGAFKLKSGTVRFDESGKAGGSVVVDAASGESGSGARDGRMHKNILESPRFPEAVFTPDRVEGKVAPSGASRVQVHGVIRLHGTDHEMTLDTQLEAHDGQLEATMKFVIPYVAWGLKNPSTFLLKVEDKVEMEIHAVGRLHS